MIAPLLAAAAMAMPGAALPVTSDAVSIPGKFYSPADLTVLVGETVTWRNDDAITHTVTSDDAMSFSSGSIAPGVSFQQTFDKPGTYAYHCTIHRQMQGMVTVAALGLSAPSGVLAAGTDATFDALLPPGAGPVTLERATAGGGFEAVGDPVQPGADGHASLHAMVDAPGRYRARAGALLSSVVRVAVAPMVTSTVHRAGRTVTVRATIAPAVPGATVELQRYVRERFDYLPVRMVRSKTGGTVTFRYRTRSRAALRVALVKAPGGWSPATARHFVVRAAR